MEPLPRLLETYEEARLLLEAKGWGGDPARVRAADGDRHHGPAGPPQRPSPASPPADRSTRLQVPAKEPLREPFWTRIAVTAASGALVGCLALLVAPLLAGATQPGPLVLVLPGAGPNGSTVSFDPRNLIDMPAAWGEKPLDHPFP